MPLKKHRITVESSVSIETQYKYISLKNTCPQYFSPDKLQVIDLQKRNDSLSLCVHSIIVRTSMGIEFWGSL